MSKKKTRILMVDDEPNILDGYRRHLGRRCQLVTAEGGAAALKIMDEQEPFPVVFTDMRMPGMDGVAFLQEAQKKHGESVFLMLTGNADQQTAIDAINKGHIFRFLNKPCSPDLLEESIKAALRQYELVQAERVLLRDTLSGSVKLLVETVMISHPELGKTSAAIRRDIQVLSTALGLTNDWRLPLAGSLCLLGCIVSSDAGVKQSLTDEYLSSCAESGARLLRHIPRLGEVAQMIERQREDGSMPANLDDPDVNTRIEIGSRFLRFVVDLQREAEASNGDLTAALRNLRSKPVVYDKRLFAAAIDSLGQLSGAQKQAVKRERVSISIRLLEPGMELDQDIFTKEQKLLISKGQTLTSVMVERLRSYSKTNLADEVVMVYVEVRGGSEIKKCA